MFVYILKLFFFTKPNNVILNLLARSITRLVGAPTPAIRPILDINPFWINSKFNLPEHAINWEWLSISFFLCVWPISLSKALCLPTSSLVAITFPSLSISALAWIPPVFENSDCSFVNNSGDFKIVFLLILGKDKFNFSFFITSTVSKDVLPHTPHEELVKKFLLNFSISIFFELLMVASILFCML